MAANGTTDNRSPLDAKLHQGYDPATEFAEKSNVFSHVRFSGSDTAQASSESDKPQDKDGDQSAQNAASKDAPAVPSQNTASSDDDTAPANGAIGSAASSSGAASSGNSFPGLDNTASDPSSGGGTMADLAQGTAVGSSGGGGAGSGNTAPGGRIDVANTPRGGGGGGNNEPANPDGPANPVNPNDPENPNDPGNPGNPGTPFPSPVLNTPPALQGNEDQSLSLNIQAMVPMGFWVSSAVTIRNVPPGVTLSAGVDNRDGTWTLTPAQLTGLTIALPVHDADDFQLTVTVTSTNGTDTTTASGTINITGNGVAMEPVLDADPASGAENTAIPLNINAQLADNDGSEVLSITITGVPAGAILSAGIANSDGTWTLTPAQLIGLTITPPLNSADDFTLTVTATSFEDGTNASVSSTIIVSVNGVAEMPVLDTDPAAGNENTAIALNIDAQLQDTDGLELLSITIGGVPAGAVLSAGIDNQDGTWTLTPAQLIGLTITPPLNSAADFILTVTATSSEDGTTETVSSSLVVTVNGVPETPVLDTDPASGNENTAIALNIDAQLQDSDGSETLVITIAGVPTGAILSAGIDNQNGTWTLTPAQLAGLTITPPLNSADDFTLTITATSTEDGTSETVSSNLVVTVNGVAETPLLDTDPAAGNENTAIALNIDAQLQDNDGSELLSITIAGVPAGAVLSAGTDNQNGTWTLTPAQLTGLTITPLANSAADFTLTVTATSSEDGTTASVSTSLTVTVAGVAETPVLETEPASGNENTAIALNIDAQLQDNDGSELLSITIAGVPAGAVLSAGTDNQNGTWTLTPAQLTGLTITPPVNAGTDFTLTVTATSTEDGTTASVTSSLVVTVNGVAETPILSVAAALTGDEDTAIALPISASLGNDGDGSEHLSIVISGVPAGAVLSAGLYAGNGIWSLSPADLTGLTITPPHHFNGAINLQITAVSTEQDGDSISSPADSCTITVTGVVDVPLVSVQAATGGEDSAIALVIQTGLIDRDGSETISITLSGVPSGALLSAGQDNHNGTWTLTPAQLANLTVTPPHDSDADFTLTATVTTRENDGATAITIGSLSVHIEAIADSPSLSVMDETGVADAAVDLHIAASLADTDGSEHLSVVIGGVPDGAVLSHGLNNGDSSWTLSSDDLNGLSITPPAHFTGDINLSVTAYASEYSNGDTASVTDTISVHVDDNSMSLMMMTLPDAHMGSDPAAYDASSFAAADYAGDASSYDSAAGTDYSHAFNDGGAQAA